MNNVDRALLWVIFALCLLTTTTLILFVLWMHDVLAPLIQLERMLGIYNGYR
jgi:hypothetical protein